MISVIFEAKARVCSIAKHGEPEESWYRRLQHDPTSGKPAMPDKDMSTAFPLHIQQSVHLPVTRRYESQESRAMIQGHCQFCAPGNLTLT
ncbi:hypothetical protein [Bradyrhizobium sp. sGM-13]|uniref:hypothetical protein n=1 Tax=Bradyrhizobium sp. sGM-13 TaxID=2831781 RepID=UPI001BCE3912|nr:hypothetical protein [Bradyrhizobium sp. sGM-13]